MKKVKIVFQWTDSERPVGGVEVVCNNYLACSDTFRINGVELDKINYQIPNDSIFRKIKNTKLLNLVYGFKQYFFLTNEVKCNPAEILHFHTSRRWLFRKDLLIIKHLYKKYENNIFITIHVGDISTVFSNRIEQKYFIGLLNSCVRKTFFLSKHMMQQFIDAGLNEERCSVLYNFCFTDRTPANEKQHSSQLLSLASINRDKGTIELLKAARSLPQGWKLSMCGAIIEPEIQVLFEELISESVGKVEYHGLVGYEKKNKLLRESDIFVLPSYREGMPISILEALNHSCAIITTPVGAIPEILKDHEHCIYVEPKNVQSLAKAIVELTDNNELMERIQINNEKLSYDFSKERHIKSLCSFYNEC